MQGPKSDSDSESSGKGEHDSRHSTKSHHQPPQRSAGPPDGQLTGTDEAVGGGRERRRAGNIRALLSLFLMGRRGVKSRDVKLEVGSQGEEGKALWEHLRDRSSAPLRSVFWRTGVDKCPSRVGRVTLTNIAQLTCIHRKVLACFE